MELYLRQCSWDYGKLCLVSRVRVNDLVQLAAVIFHDQEGVVVLCSLGGADCLKHSGQ